MSDNWVVQNLENALEVWNGKLSEIWQLITQSPQTFKGGSIWSVIVNIHGALQAIGYALLVLFFVVGVVKTCGSFADLKKPEHAVKLFVRFAIAKGLITYGMELMMEILEIIQGVVSTIMNAAGFGTPQATILPQEIITAIEDCGFFESIPLWAVTLIGGLFIWVLSFVMILSVYGRFFKMYMYTAIAPVPLSSFAGEPTQNIGKSFLKSYASVCLEGAIIVLACIIFSVFASSPPVVNPDAAAASHGTGCTLSAALAAAFALELPWEQALCEAKGFVLGSLREAVWIAPEIPAMYPPVEDSVGQVRLEPATEVH